jgi:hypothetical protein
MDLWTTYTHDTAPQLISTIHKSPQHSLSHFPACCVFTSRSLATAANSGDPSASRAQVLSSQPPVHNWLSSYNSALRLAAISHQLPSLLLRDSLTTEHSCSWLTTPWHGPRIKHRFQQFLYCWVLIRCCRDVFTAPLRSNGRSQQFLCRCVLFCCRGNLFVCDRYLSTGLNATININHAIIHRWKRNLVSTYIGRCGDNFITEELVSLCLET